MFRKLDGILFGFYIVLIGLVSNEVVINEVLDFDFVFDGLIEFFLFMFGIVSCWCNNVLIIDIKFLLIDRVKVIVECYDERVYLDDNSLVLI